MIRTSVHAGAKRTNLRIYRIYLSVAFLLPILSVPAAAPRTEFNVRNFGALGDGTAHDTAAIQQTLDACAAAGGGTVIFPQGTYLSGALFLNGPAVIRMEEGSVLSGTTNLADYPLIDSRWEGTEEKAHAALINASNIDGITITGSGEIAGSGAGDSRPPAGPRVIEFIRCSDIRIENIRVTNKGRWTIHPIYSSNITVSNVTVFTTGHNSDGFNPDSCSNVLVTASTFRTGDDCIAVKSGKNRQALEIGIPCQDITVTDCTMLGGHGGVVIGSEMSGGIRNVTVRNCTFSNMWKGIRLKTRIGRGGLVENIVYDNIRLVNVAEPLVLNMHYNSNPGDLIEGEAGIPRLRNIVLTNISMDTCGNGMMHGIEQSPVDGLVLKNIFFSGSKQLDVRYVNGLVIENVTNTDGGEALTLKQVRRADAHSALP